MKIFPTKTAFDDVLDFLEQLWVKGNDRAVLEEYTVVHGICLGPADGEPFSHGWIEHDLTETVWQSGFVLDQRVQYAVDRAAFYQALRVQRFTRYTVQEALAENYRTNHYGPWLSEYQALCTTSGKLRGEVEFRSLLRSEED